MELELGLKITKTRDDSTSISEYRLAKDRTGPVFQSRETNTMFILIAHLKGYKRNNIHIKINEDGSKISISGEKPVQEMLMLGGVMFKKGVEIMSFSKVFKIPDGVILDWIKAKYDEEEWMLKIVMPKSVKGICGARIEEVEEDESDIGRSELGRSEEDHILNTFGEASGKEAKGSEVQEMKDSGGVMVKGEVSSEKMLDGDANVNRIKGTIKDGGGTSVRKKVGKTEHDAMETSDSEKNVGTSIPQNIGDTSQHKESEIQETDYGEGFVEKNGGIVSEKMLNNTSGGISGVKIQEEIEDENGPNVREKGDRMKTPEIEQKVGAGIPQNIRDTSHDKVSELQEMQDDGTCSSNVEKKEKMVSDKMLDGAKGNVIGEGESVREHDRKAGYEAMKTLEQEQNVGAHIPLSIGDASHELSKDSVVQQTEEAECAVEDGKMLAKVNGFSQKEAYGESKQKEFEQRKSKMEDIHKGSGEEVIGMERFEETKTSKFDQDVVADHIPSNIRDMVGEEKESKECGVQQMKKNGSVEANNAIQEKSNETANGDEECQEEKADREGFEPVVITLREEFPKAPQEVGKRNNVSNMKESRAEVTEKAKVRTKGNETECSVQKGEGEEPGGVHVETSTLIEKDITEEKRQGETEKPMSEIKGSDQRQGFEVLDSIRTAEEFPKQVGEKLSDGSNVIRDAKTEAESLMENVEVGTSKKTTMKSNETLQKEDEKFGIGRKAKEGLYVPDNIAKGELDVIGIQVKVPEKVKADKTEYGILKLKGEGSIRMNLEANKIFEEDITRERSEKETREPKFKSRDQLRVEENIENGGVDGSKIEDLPGVVETEQVREKGAKTEQTVQKYEIILANEDFGRGITRETIKKEIKDPKIQAEEIDQCMQGKMDEVEVSMAAKEEFPMKIAGSLTDERERLKDTKIEEAEDVEEELVKQESEEKVGETEDIKDDAETEHFEKKVKEERYEKEQVETNGGKMKDIIRETSQKETEDPKIQTKEKNQQCLPEALSKQRPEVSIAVQKEEPLKRIDSLESERLQETILEKEEAQAELVKQQSDEKMEETEDVKDNGAETEAFVKKEKGGKYEKIQVEARGGMSKDIITEMAQKGTKEPEIQREDKDQQCLPKDAMSEGIFEASTTEREFPLQIIDLQAKRGDGPKDEKMEVTEKIKQEVGERKNKETKEKIQESEGGRITKTLQEVQKEEHPEVLDIGLDERELQPKERQTTHEKVVRMGSEEFEQGSAKKQKTEQLSPTIQSKDNLQSRNGSVDQDIVESKKAKEPEVGQQCTYNTESTKEVAAIGDQVAKPRFPSNQQFEVQEGNLQEGCKEKYESQKECHTKDLQNITEMNNQESQHMEVLKPEVPLEALLKRREQNTRKDEFQEGQKVEETMLEEIDQPKNKIDDGDQQDVQQDVGKEVGTKEEYASNATHERVKDMTQNVNDNQLRVKEEVKDTDFDSTKEKEHQRTSKSVEKEADPLEEISPLPSFTSKDLSPPTAETKTKEPPELEQSIAERKLPETKEYVPESSNRKQYIYGTEDIEAAKSNTYNGAKPSGDEENRKSENDVEESPKTNTDREFQTSIEWGAPIEKEYVETFLGNILKNQGLGEKQEVYGREEAAPAECDNQERDKEGYNDPKISTADRGQQYVQEDNDKKGYQTTKAINEELLSEQHGAEKIVLEEREVPKVTWSEEPKESSKQLYERVKGKEIKIGEDKMPETNKMTPEFEEASRFKQDSDRIKKGMEELDREEMLTPPTKIQRKEPYELSWSSMATQRYQPDETDKEEASDEVGNRESRNEYTRTNVQYSNKSETGQEVDQVETPQVNSYKDQLCINKDEEESKGKHEAVGEKARKLQEDEECEVITVEKEEKKCGNKDKTRTKKLFVPLAVAGSTLLVSLVCIFIHRNRARKRSKI